MSWGLLALIALVSPVYGSSTETTQPEFSLLIVSFLFLMGVSQAGVVFCSMLRLSYAQWAKPYYRLAELSTLAFFPFAIVGFLLIFFFAKVELFYWLSASPDAHQSPWLNSDWLLVRNLLGLLVFYGVSAIYIWKGLQPDLKGASDVDHREVERQLYLLSPLVLISFVICNTLLAWDFGMMLIPHWHSWQRLRGHCGPAGIPCPATPILSWRVAFWPSPDPQSQHADQRLYAAVVVFFLGSILCVLVW